MEKSYGIEAARAQLGEIADHARTTGQVTELTRHGRTVAVIGPATDVTPSQGVQATLLFPTGRDWGGYLPGVPQKGDSLTRDSDYGEEVWSVYTVEWYLGSSDRVSLYVHLVAANDRTENIVTTWRQEGRAKRTNEK